MADAWWRVDWAPTAGEWQAFWGLLSVAATVLLIVIAWRQLRGLAMSNSALAESNDLLAASNKALSRPVIVVEFRLQTTPSRDYANTRATSVIFILVKNVGPTAARDIHLKVTPPFEVANTAIHQAAQDFVRERFSGEEPIRMLTPGQELKYLLDTAEAALGNESLPSEYEVEATYTDISGTDRITETFFLSTEAWAFAISEDDPMARISKDIQFVSDNLEKVARILSER